MPERHLFEYAVIRIVPRVEREEFLNAGVILYSKNLRFLGTRVCVQNERIIACFPDADLTVIERHLQAFDKICAGAYDSGPIGKLDIASRFRWLTAARSTIVQTSRVHPGFTPDPETTLEKLFRELVC